jgi:hypothetical protein
MLREEQMALKLGSTILAKGCLTRLIDVVNREPALLEDLVGFYRFRLRQGFYFLLLRQALLPRDFEFFGYTYMSGGKLGLPSNNPTIESARPKVHDALMASLQSDGPKVAADVIEQFVRTIQLKGQERYVKIVPFIGQDRSMGSADQYPSSKLGIKQLNLKEKKEFLVAAEVHGSIWTIAKNGLTKIDVGSPPRYDLPYRDDPRKKVMDFLANA